MDVALEYKSKIESASNIPLLASIPIIQWNALENQNSVIMLICR